MASKLSDQETRDGWWSELRDEIRSHARTLCCAHVVGYMEASTIHDDVCVLSITGTAATVRGLPDLAQAQRMWAEWEMQQNEIISRVEGGGGRSRHRASYPGEPTPGDSSPGSIVSATADTPFSGAMSDNDGREMRGGRGDDEPPGEETGAADIVRPGIMAYPGSTDNQFGNFSRRAIKEAKLQRNAQRLERRLRKMGVGRRGKKGRRAQMSSGLSTKERDIDKSSFVSNVLLRARLARPCSYCHVPYHHRLAPFTNMKLVPCVSLS